MIPPQKKDRKLLAMYRRVFVSPEGQRVLADILADCGHFRLVDSDSPLQTSLSNYAKHLLSCVGYWDGVDAVQYVKGLLACEPGLRLEPEEGDIQEDSDENS